MFTGIIEDLGIVKSLTKGQCYRLAVTSPIFAGQKIGDSISVNGACLTISGLKGCEAVFDIMAETLEKTNLSGLKPGEKVNLERALKVGDRIGGHFVTGHIDCTGKLTERTSGKTEFLRVQIPKENMKFIVRKGSVALDGVSLTVADIGEDNFTVYLIPHTLKSTNLGRKTRGDSVNIEFDIIGKYALHLTKEGPATARITEEFLRRKGFY